MKEAKTQIESQIVQALVRLQKDQAKITEALRAEILTLTARIGALESRQTAQASSTTRSLSALDGVQETLSAALETSLATVSTRLATLADRMSQSEGTIDVLRMETGEDIDFLRQTLRHIEDVIENGQTALLKRIDSFANGSTT